MKAVKQASPQALPGRAAREYVGAAARDALHGSPLQRAQAGCIAALDGSPAMVAQRERLSRLTGTAVQRKVLINDVERPAKEGDDPKLQDAIADEYLRFYKDEPEMQNHLVAEQRVPIGLIKHLALWYRLPDFANQFFVFGEYHSGVKGSLVQEASHFDKPILDEALTGWTSGVAETQPSPGETTSETNKRPPSAGLDENGAKLWRGIEYVRWRNGKSLEALTKPSTSPSTTPTQSPLPSIPTGKNSTRIADDGSYRLVVRGEGGKEELWTPKVPVPKPTYDSSKESSDAVTSLFPKVFGKEILEGKLDLVLGGLAQAWDEYNQLASATDEPGQESLKKMEAALAVIENATRKRVQGRYQEDYLNTEAKLGHPRVLGRTYTQAPQRGAQGADIYRDEFMLLRVHQAHKEQNFAFATMGDAHRKRLQSRMEEFGVKSIAATDFYGPAISKDAVET